jgi:Flp pilus assembly protein TadD
LAKLKDPYPDVQIHTCAQCHSRRRVVHPDFRPGENYYDYFANELLLPHTYFADGQILDEVYVYASFLQSKMYHNKIRCTDCHDPHSTKLKFSGNQVCTSCHAHPAGKYDGPAHHHHDVNSKGASCVECHMPETTYMEVDPRRDHSLRVPRPDLSVKLGTPNACTACHLDASKISEEKRVKLKQYRDWVVAAQAGDEEIKAELSRLDRWARDYTDQWYGPMEEPDMHFANALAAARNRDPSAELKLEDVARDLRIPAVVRATAIYELASFNSPQSRDSVQRALKDSHPLVRATAVSNLESFIPSVGHRNLADYEAAPIIAATKPIVGALVPLLADPVRLVRTEAARVLARVPYQIRSDVMSGSERRTMDAALDEFKAGVLVNNDRAGAHMTLGILYENLGDLVAAEDAYRTAIRVEPGVSGPRTNLAALLDQQAQAAEERIRGLAARGDRAAAEQLVPKIMQFQDAAQQLRSEELELLARDARLAADNAAIQYRYGLSLYLHGRVTEAEAALVAASKLEPTNSDFLLALVLLYQKLERWSDALSHAQRLVQLRPQDRSYQQLLEDIRQQSTQPSINSEP